MPAGPAGFTVSRVSQTMQCPDCSFDNPDDAGFCGRCGHALIEAVHCDRCGVANPSENEFCNHCGAPLLPIFGQAGNSTRPYTPRHLAEKILTTRSALEGERKQVTVLFVDVKGSMDLAARVDPEEWHRILDRFFQILGDGVHRFEGTINQFTGDGIMALFGAPVAHEDHAQRACLAALYLRDRLRVYATDLRLRQGLDFAVRIGMNSGEVVVGRIGDDLRMDYTAQGQVVGLAERVQSIAEPGTIYLTAATASLVEGYFDLEPLGPCRVRGMEDSIQVFRLRTADPTRTRLDISRARGLTRFVGRAAETAALEQALGHARDGQGTVLGIAGKAGTGKTRLCYEFVSTCHARRTNVIEVYGVPHGVHIPLWPVVRLFRRFFDIDESASPQIVRRRIAGHVALLDGRLLDCLPLVFDFLGVPEPDAVPVNIDPEARQRRLFNALRSLLLAECRRRTTVILMEDLHRIDRGSEEFLSKLVDSIPAVRALLILTFRPEYDVAWSGRTNYAQVTLGPLADPEVSQLLENLMGNDGSLDELKRLIGERAGGNPLYLEEIVRSLDEEGRLEGNRGAYRLVAPITEIGVPASIQALIEARIDRMDEQDKRVLMLAAVIGRQFAIDVLRRVTDLSPAEVAESIRALSEAEYIFPISLYPREKYVFAHPLTQEVAYAAQLADHRRQIHGAVAKAIEALAGDRPNRKASVIAHHYEQSGEVLEAASWHQRAARWAGRNDLPAAYEHWENVRDLVATLAPSAETDELALRARWRMLNLGWRLGIAEEDAQQLFSEGMELATRLEDVPSQVAIRLFFGVTRMMAGRIEEALDIFAEARKIAEATGDPALVLEPLGPPIHALISTGRLSEGLTAARQALTALQGKPEAGREFFELTPSLYLRCCRGEILLLQGDSQTGGEELRQVAREARRSGDPEILGWALGSLARTAALEGDVDAARARIGESIEIAERVGALSSRVRAAVNLSLVHLAGEAFEEAADAARSILPLARERRIGLDHEPILLACLAQALARQGDAAEAVTTAREAFAKARQYGTRLWEIPACLSLACALGAEDRSANEAEIRTVLDDARNLIDETGARAFMGWLEAEVKRSGTAEPA